MRQLNKRLRRRVRRMNLASLWPVGVLAGGAAAIAAFVMRRSEDDGPLPLVKDVMVNEVITLDSTATLLEAAKRMRDGNVGVLPVIEDGRLRGIVTDRDLVVRGMAEGVDPSTTRIGECATWNIVCAQAESSLDEAMEVMADSQIGRLPVVDGENRVIGMLTLSSLALRSSKRQGALTTAQEVSKRSSRAA